MTRVQETSFQDSAERERFIFVSYARKDSEFVYPEINRLRRAGYRIWYDKMELRPSRVWWKEISKAIESCSCFIVFITQTAADSERVCEEIDLALSLNVPFICIEWEKAVLPPRFRRPFDEIQTLKRYELRTREYEVPLRRALSEYVGTPEPSAQEKDSDFDEVLRPLSSGHTSSGISPKAVCFVLILLAVLAFFFAIVAVTVPFFGGYGPTDPLGSHLAGNLTGLVFMLIAGGLGGAAFAIRRKYRRQND